MKGVAVIYVGEDLDVLLELCDRIRGALRRPGHRRGGRPHGHTRRRWALLMTQ